MAIPVIPPSLASLPVSIEALASVDERRLHELAKVVDGCLSRGINFDQFFTDYIQAEGKRLYWNPFWRHGEAYSPAELYMQLRHSGYGSVPEAAVNVFWQMREKLFSAN